MANGIQEIEDLVVLENWELARQVILESPRFEDEKKHIEVEFEISLDDLGSIVSLPAKRFKTLQRRLLDIIKNYFDSVRKELHKKICIEYEYCKKKNNLGWRLLPYLAGILDIFITKGGAFLAVLAIKTEVFDRLCKCER